MPYLHAELQIAGRQVRCDHVSYSFLQTTDDKGRPSSVVRTGFLIVVISGEAAGWSLWEEIKLNDFRRESGHVVFFQSEYTTTKRYTFYDAALIHLEFRYDGKGTTNRHAATEVELHFSAATIEVHGIRLENFSLIPWATSPATSFKALTKPADPLPSAHLAAGAALLAQAAKETVPEIIEQVKPIPFAGLARTLTLLPSLLLRPMNADADLSKDYDNQLYNRNHPAPIPPPPKPDALRLAELERALANRALDTQEEAELIVLLAKVKGIHIPRLSDLKGTGPNGTIAVPIFTALLPTEGNVGTYKELSDAGRIGDDVTAHHVPSDAFIKQHGIATNDGICINMEQPRRGGRHRKTKTCGGNMTPAEREAYYKMSPKEALDYDIQDVRRIFREEGKLTPEIEQKIQEVVKQNKTKFPHLYN